MDYVHYKSKGNAADFGDLTNSIRLQSSTSNSIRMLTGGGYPGSSSINSIDYVTMSSVGNATDFGDLTVARHGDSGLASPTKGVFSGGNSSGDTIDFVTIMTTGNATNFGDLTSLLFIQGYTKEDFVFNPPSDHQPQPSH